MNSFYSNRVSKTFTVKHRLMAIILSPLSEAGFYGLQKQILMCKFFSWAQKLTAFKASQKSATDAHQAQLQNSQLNF